MKKTLWITLCLMMLCMVALTACGGDREAVQNNAASSPSADTKAPETNEHAHAFGSWTIVKDATCAEAGEEERVCSCGEKETQSIAAVAHTEVIDDAVEATCIAEGKTEGKHCSVCGEVLAEQAAVSKLGHTEVIESAVAATCVADGKTEGKHCSVCDAILVEQVVVDKLGHTAVVDGAVAATCAAEGKTEGKHCSVCGEVLVAQTAVSKLAHTVVVDSAVAATCTASGKTEGKHCSVCQTVIEKQEWTSVLPCDYENGVCTMCGDAPEILVSKIWMDKPGKTVRAGSCLTFYVEAYFKYDPDAVILWFQSTENTSSKKSAVGRVSKTSSNVYSVTLDITDKMFPSKWVANWYFVKDKYGTYIQRDFTAQQRDEIWFIVS